MAVTTPTDTELLAALARILEEAVHSDPAGTAIFVRRFDSEIELGLRRLDPELHPCLELRGFVAPEDWWAFGLVTHGTATFLDEDRSERIVSTHLRSRSGEEVSLLRRGDTVQELPGRGVGRIPDLVRSVLPLAPGGPTGAALAEPVDGPES
jgi:hypothetical protein